MSYCYIILLYYMMYVVVACSSIVSAVNLELFFLFQHIIRGNRPIKAEMAHQLYVLQVLTFNLLEERMMTKMDPNDQVKNINIQSCNYN